MASFHFLDESVQGSLQNKDVLYTQNCPGQLEWYGSKRCTYRDCDIP
jgi:hypothetical protein